MKLYFDKASDSLYIHLAEHVALNSDEGDTGLVMDGDVDGTMVGIGLCCWTSKRMVCCRPESRIDPAPNLANPAFVTTQSIHASL